MSYKFMFRAILWANIGLAILNIIMGDYELVRYNFIAALIALVGRSVEEIKN